MKPSCHMLSALGAALLCSLPVSAATVTTLDVDFENPSFTIGLIGGNPPYSGGQGGWGGYGSAAITDSQAHSGTQSLASGGISLTPHGSNHTLDPAIDGDYPSNTVNFPTGYLADWWLHAWVYVPANGLGARMSVLPWGWYLQVSGTGVLSVETALSGQGSAIIADAGALALDRWVYLEMAHTTSMQDSNGSYMELRFLSDRFDYTVQRGYGASGPNSQYVFLSGDAYWDDVAAGRGLAPAPVPIPGALWLFAPALALLTANGRRRRA